MFTCLSVGLEAKRGRYVDRWYEEFGVRAWPQQPDVEGVTCQHGYASRPVSSSAWWGGWTPWSGSLFWSTIHDSLLLSPSLVHECPLQGWQTMFYCPEMATDKDNVSLGNGCLLGNGSWVQMMRQEWSRVGGRCFLFSWNPIGCSWKRSHLWLLKNLYRFHDYLGGEDLGV